MIKNIKTYVDINGIILNKETYYLITYTKIYEVSLFGNKIKEFKKIEEVPFVFKSYDIAKDFCKLNPIYKKYTIYGNSNHFESYYRTYEILLNNKIKSYIIWKTTLMTYNYERSIYKTNTEYPIVKGFINKESNITFPNSNEIRYGNNSPKILNINDKLSDIFSILENDKHHFELIEQ